jgi:predicted polyphosphate/ATP-dependent NAD kinase
VLTFALLVNPVAGVGGAVALKGSDGADIQAQARSRGGVARSSSRALRALKAAGAAAQQVRWLTWGGVMGADVLRGAGLAAETLGEPAQPCSAGDTDRAARAMGSAGADLIVFCGGDGTARDLFQAVGQDIPVLGIPAGVKMHSGVFATTPESAGHIIAALVEGGLVQATVGEVRDLDEAALREGVVEPRFYGEMAVPEAGGFLQHTKEGGRESEPLALEEIVAEITQRIADYPGVYVLGPGGSLAAIKAALGMDATLIGVDVLHHDRQAGRDVDAGWLTRYLEQTGEPVILVLSFTRQQGFLLGRGNQQLSPAVLRRIGRARLWVVGTRTKLASLEGRPLLIDTDDPELDREWAGLVEVIAGYQDSLFYRVSASSS